ncbi:MAG: hypothetical protein FJX77_01665 [Armatimonadetes bacterium]|nr:hypothetical protein [Armatimonadota bacterium]
MRHWSDTHRLRLACLQSPPLLCAASGPGERGVTLAAPAGPRGQVGAGIRAAGAFAGAPAFLQPRLGPAPPSPGPATSTSDSALRRDRAPGTEWEPLWLALRGNWRECVRRALQQRAGQADLGVIGRMDPDLCMAELLPLLRSERPDHAT